MIVLSCEIMNQTQITDKMNGEKILINQSGNYCSARSYSHGSQVTRIPLPRQARMTPPPTPEGLGGKENNSSLGTYVERWKNRYEDAERRFKSVMVKNEKVKREYDDLSRRYTALEEQKKVAETELHDRENKLSKLRAVSEKVYKEYEQLRNQHDVDAGVMQKVMHQAGEWYKQNKQLKRKSTAILQALPLASSLVDIDLTDATDAASDASSNEELEFLKQTVSELSRQVAELQTELSAAKLQEFEATEANVNLTQELEAEREARQQESRELLELRALAEQHQRVSKLLIEEVGALKTDAEKDRERAETFKSEASAAKKRVKILTHQSALLVGDLELDERLLLLLQEVEDLKTALENQNLRHLDVVEDMQEKLAEKNAEDETFLWEEKIKMAEEDARKAMERAERAELKLAEMKQAETKPQTNNRSAIFNRIHYFESGVNSQVQTQKSLYENSSQEPNPKPMFLMQKSISENDNLSQKNLVNFSSQTTPTLTPSSILINCSTQTEVAESKQQTPSAPLAPPPPPPPPPPPCLPPPPPMNVGCAGKTTESAIADMAKLLGLKQNAGKANKNAAGGAIDEIVNQIKGGKFQLKSTDQNFMERRPPKEEPEAVKEMLTILGTLRKRRNVNRPSFVSSPSVEAAAANVNTT